MDLDTQLDVATPLTADKAEERVALGLVKGRLNYDLGDYYEALLHLTDAYQVMQRNGPVNAWTEADSVKYHLYKAYTMASPKDRAIFKKQVNFLHLEGAIVEEHGRAVWLTAKIGRPGLRFHDFLERIGL